MHTKLLGAIRGLLIALVVLSGAIAVPILCRPFYYHHIVPLDLSEVSGLTVQQIKTAYGEVMRFCIGLTDTFSVGDLPFSQSGAAHFADVRRLFVLDLWVWIAGILLLAGTYLRRSPEPVRLFGHTPGFWSAIGLSATLLTIGGLAVADFDRAFTLFHKLFFPGKDNWFFDPLTDPVVMILPEEFFRNCAILILVLVILISIALIVNDSILRNKGKNNPVCR